LGIKNAERRRRTGFQVFLGRFPSRDLLSEAKKKSLSPQVRVPNLGKTLKIMAFSAFFVSSAWQKNEGFGTLKTLNRNPTLFRGYDL